MRFQGIDETIGKTPLVRLGRLAADLKIYAKLEAFNPLSSVKDRIGRSMIEAAEREGELKPGGTIVEPTSGNTGIALAFIAAARGYRLILTMPETMSQERRQILKTLGAELVLTPAESGMRGAHDEARRLVQSHPEAVLLDQFANPANPLAHYRTTGPEIWEDLSGEVDVLVAGVGTGGTLSGTGQFLREKNPDLKIFAVEPEESPLLSQGVAGPHRIQGIGANFVPEILNRGLIDEVLTVNAEEAAKMTRRLATTEGILAGISAGAAVWAALSRGRDLGRDSNIVVILPDSGERYLSTWIFE